MVIFHFTELVITRRQSQWLSNILIRPAARTNGVSYPHPQRAGQTWPFPGRSNTSVEFEWDEFRINGTEWFFFSIFFWGAIFKHDFGESSNSTTVTEINMPPRKYS